MPPAPKHTRRWFQIRLGTMLVLMMAIAVLLGQFKVVRDRQRLRTLVYKNGGLIADTDYRLAANDPRRSKDVPFWRRWLGDSSAAIVALPDSMNLESVTRLFPEARIEPYPARPLLTTQEIKTVEIEFQLDDQDFKLKVTDPKLIESTIVQPLHSSEGVVPRTLIALGTLTLHYDDGTSEEFGIFRPWGFWSQKGTQFLGNLSELRNTCREAVRVSGSRNAATLIKDPMYWD